MTEREIQHRAVTELRRQGFTVIVTSARKRNVTRGIPDLIIRITGRFCILADAKAPGGKPTKEQAALVDAGMLTLFSDPADLIVQCVLLRSHMMRKLKLLGEVRG